MSVKQFLGLGGPPKPAGGGDPWGGGVASAVQAWLASQPDVNDQRRMQMERDLYGARTDLAREQVNGAKAEAAIKAVDLLGKQRQDAAVTAMPGAIEQFLKGGAPLDGGLEGPTQPLSFGDLYAKSFAATGNDPVKATRTIMGMMGDRITPEMAHSLQYAAGVTPNLDEAPTFATQGQYRDQRAAQEAAKQQGEMDRARLSANATVQAARLRATSGGGEKFQIVDSTDANGNPIKVRVPLSGGDATPIMMGNQPLAGKGNELPASEQQKNRQKLSASDSLLQTIAAYEENIKNNGFLVQDMGTEGSKQRALFNQIRMRVKDIYDLGAPQAGDMQILAEALPGHTDVGTLAAMAGGAFGGGGAEGRQLARLSELKGMAQRTRTQITDQMTQGKSYRGESSGTPAAPGTPSPASGGKLRIVPQDVLAEARSAVSRGAPKEAIAEDLRAKGYDPAPIIGVK